MFLITTFLLLICFLIGGASAATPGPTTATYYVSPSGGDSNNGSQRHPWLTITHAATAVRPGAVVHVAPGKYFGPVVTSASGTASARIRFVSDQKWGAQVIGSTGSEAAWQNRGDYVDIAGFDVTGSSPNGIENLGNSVRIIGNHVHDITPTCDSNGGSGINNSNYSAADNDIIGNYVHDVRQDSSCASKHGVGIYHSNLRGHVCNNLSFHNGTVGIQLWHAANGVVVANNTVFGNGVNGIVVGAGDSPGGVTNDHSEIANNIVVNNVAYGIQEFGATGPHNQFLNNLVNGNRTGNLELLTGSASGTVMAPPLFVHDTGDPSGNYHLQARSPAVNAGVSQYAPPTDADGALRPAGSAPAIGAFEYGTQPGRWPWQ